MKRFKYIKDLIYKYKYRYLIGITALILVDIFQLVLPKVLGNVTDLLQNGSLTKHDLIKYSLIVAGIAFGIAFFRFFWRYMVFGVSKEIEAMLRRRFYSHLQTLSISYFNTHKTGDLMAHATNDINNISLAIGQGFALGLDSSIIPVVAVIMMIKTAGLWLTIISFIPLIILALILVFLVNIVHTRLEKVQESFSQLTEVARENISGIRVVKSFVQEIKEIQKFAKTNHQNKNTNQSFMRVMSLLFSLIMSISSVSFALALWFGGMEVINGNLTLGSFIAFNGYLGMLIWPIAALGWITSMFQRGFVSMDRINKILDEIPEIKDPEEVLNLNKINGNIAFKNLSFSYTETSPLVLKNINLNLENGKTLAIIGRTGSGKTTLINLIQHLYSIPDGTIFIDQNDINKIPLETLRQNIGCVPQDSFLFSLTIKENIDFFHEADFENIIKAAKTARIYENIMDFPHKFETIVGERGLTLSGGQKQRLSIARAILREPSILLLDDCLSAVDTHTEEEILTGLKEIMHNRTSIIVSHRVSAIKDADEIIVLEAGEIIERGTHEELLQLAGTYYDLYNKQLLAEQIEKTE